MQRRLISLVASATLISPVLVGALIPAAAYEPEAAERRHWPSAYQLTGDAGGSKFEGIGADKRRGLYYVSEVTGGEIHRGQVRSAHTEEWLAGDGTDGRFTTRGITTDWAGNVYIAGGPNGLGNDRPDLWVYSRSGELLAALRAARRQRVLERRLDRSRWVGVLHQLQRPTGLSGRGQW